MDIGNLWNISSNNSMTSMAASNASVSKLEEQLQTDYSSTTDEELMGACKQFEAYFLEQMFKAMEKTVPSYSTDGMSGSGTTLMDYYKEQMIQQVAEDSTEQNSLGLAQMLYEQMKRNLE